MAQLFANNAQSTLASSVNTSTTTIPLATGTGSLFPSPSGGDFFMLTLTQPGVESSWEIVKVTARSSDSLTVVRAQEGTSSASWAAGSKAELRLTAGAKWSLANIDQSIAPTWTGAHQFNQAVGIGASNSSSTGSMLVVAGAQFNSLLVRSTGSSGGVGSSDIYLGSATGDLSGGIVGYDHTTNRLGLGAGGTVSVTIDSSGHVGIAGTPSRVGLTVGNASRTGENYIHAVTSTTDMFLGQSSATVFGFATGAIGLCFSNSNAAVGYGTSAAQPVIFGTGGVERQRIDGISGNVAIGTTTTTAARLTVAGGTGIMINGNGASGYNVLQFQNNNGKTLSIGVGGSSTSGPQANACAILTTTNDYLSFGTNNSENLRLDAGGQLRLLSAGKGISIVEGSNCKQGLATLVGGTVTVNNSVITSNSRILLTAQNISGTPGELSSSRIPGSSFTITSTSGADTRDVAYVIFEPA